MAEEVTLNGSTVKIRHPFAPIGSSIITLGIYGLYWYWAVNKELQVAGQKVEPVVSLLAITSVGCSSSRRSCLSTTPPTGSDEASSTSARPPRSPRCSPW